MIYLSRISALRGSFRSTHNNPLFHSKAEEITPSISILKLLELSIESQSKKLIFQSHARAQHLGLTQHPFIAQKLIFSYCQLGCPFDAKLVFDSLLVKNTHICNTLLSGYGKYQLFRESFGLFRKMSIFSMVDDFTFSVMFKIVGDFGEVLVGKMVHGRSVKNGLAFDTVVANSLMSMYGRCGCFDYSLKVFDDMPQRNVSSWNTLISGYAKVNEDRGDDSFCKSKLWGMMTEMQNEGLKFDAFTVSTLLSLCRGSAGNDDSRDRCGHGRELHCYIVRNCLDANIDTNGDVHLGCGLIDMYSKNSRVDVARRVFDRLKSKNVFAWTAMINGYAYCGNFHDALFLFREMQWRDNKGPNKVSLVAILPACTSIFGLMGVMQIHGFAVRRVLNHDLSLCNALIDTYSKCGSLNYATQVFEHECMNKDAISWSSIISGYGLHGQGHHAVTLFDKMLHNGIKPDATTVVGVLSACSKSGLIHDGLRVYNFVVNNHEIKPTVEICACIVDMLSRTGQLTKALDFIENMPVEAGPSIWGALLSASALHGNVEMQEIAHKKLIAMEPDNSSNYVSLSNLYASSKRWEVVAEVRQVMRKRGLKKLPGCSWISINGEAHSFVVADKSHPCSDLIYVVLNKLVSAMKLTYCGLDFEYLMEV